MKKFLLLLLILIGLLVAPQVSAAPQNITGFAWIGADNCEPDGSDCSMPRTQPVGWVSFSSNSTPNCNDYSYQVTVDYAASKREDMLEGAAWIGVGEDGDFTCETESTVGWINFSYEGSPSWSVPAYIDQYQIRGVVPVMSDKDNDGNSEIATWVKFNGPNYSNRIKSNGEIGDPGVNNSNHYAWSNYATNEGLGWINLRPSISNPVQFPTPPPTAYKLDTAVHTNVYCGKNPGHYFSWDYVDPERKDQDKYRIQVATDMEFHSVGNIEFNNIVADVMRDTSTEGGYIDVGPNSPLSYNTSYYWRLKVWDVEGDESSWIYYDPK